MRSSIPLTATALCLASFVAAQSPRTVLFTSLGAPTNPVPLHDSTLPSRLRLLYPAGIAADRPVAAPHCASKFAPQKAWLRALGDQDADQNMWENGLGQHKDALCIVSGRYDATKGPNMHEIYFSVAQDIASCRAPCPVLPLPTLRAGDLARVDEQGRFVPLVRRETLVTTFGIAQDPQRGYEHVNIDAAHFDARSNTLFLSFEEDHVMTLRCGTATITTTVHDGAVVAMQVSSFGGCGGEEAVSGLGLLVATETEVRCMVAKALGVSCGSILELDLDALAEDPNGGSFTTSCGTWSNLVFCVDQVTNAAILSTSAGGSYAVINGVAMHSALGHHLGLHGDTGLNGLVLPDTACPFPTETNTPELTGAGTVNFFVQSPVAGSYFLVASLQAASSCGLPASVALPNPCHPRLIDPASYVFGPYPLTTSAAGTHSAAWTVTVPALGSHYWLSLQAAVPLPSGFGLSTPLTIDLK